MSDAGDNLHLLERISIDLQVQNSIVPTAYSLARFKISGNLPSLKVNLSDTKYKSLMRLIDVCIPKFDDAGNTAAPVPPPQNRAAPGAFQGLFGAKETEYTVSLDEDGGDKAVTRTTSVESSEGTVDVRVVISFISAKLDVYYNQRPELRQHIFELTFQVDNLRASLSKADGDGVEKPLGDVFFDHFALALVVAKFDMKVDVNLKYSSRL